jgi:hypothetical protein
VDGQPIEQFAPYAGEAVAVLADSIASGGPHRAGVVKGVFASHGGGILASYNITSTGDPSVGPITILRAGSTFTPFREITPKGSLVSAARG